MDMWRGGVGHLCHSLTTHSLSGDVQKLSVSFATKFYACLTYDWGERKGPGAVQTRWLPPANRTPQQASHNARRQQELWAPSACTVQQLLLHCSPPSFTRGSLVISPTFIWTWIHKGNDFWETAPAELTYAQGLGSSRTCVPLLTMLNIQEKTMAKSYVHLTSHNSYPKSDTDLRKYKDPLVTFWWPSLSLQLSVSSLTTGTYIMVQEWSRGK